MGRVNKTKSGYACQAWNAQVPHSHNKPPDVFYQIKNGENFCRNAGEDVEKPWCYTMNSSVPWEHCDIPRCGMVDLKPTSF